APVITLHEDEARHLSRGPPCAPVGVVAVAGADRSVRVEVERGAGGVAAAIGIGAVEKAVAVSVEAVRAIRLRRERRPAIGEAGGCALSRLAGPVAAASRSTPLVVAVG